MGMSGPGRSAVTRCGDGSKPWYPCSSHQNSWDLSMFIPLKMVSIGIDVMTRSWSLAWRCWTMSAIFELTADAVDFRTCSWRRTTVASMLVSCRLDSLWCTPALLLLPSGKRWHNYGKSPFSMGRSTISMVIFNSYVSHYQRVTWPILEHNRILHWSTQSWPGKLRRLDRGWVQWRKPQTCPTLAALFTQRWWTYQGGGILARLPKDRINMN